MSAREPAPALPGGRPPGIGGAARAAHPRAPVQGRAGRPRRAGPGQSALAAGLGLLFLLPGCGALSSLGGGPGLADQVTIERDAWGVPHIVGRSDAAVAFGLGYAQAEDNVTQIEEDVLRAIGRAANLYGDAWLANDLLKAAFEVPRHARAEYAREPEERRRVWDAFVAGLNQYLAEHPAVRLRLLARFEPWHLFALVRDVAPGTQVDGVLLGEPAAITASLPGGAVAIAHYDSAATERPDTARASLAWAIAPARADSGRALLLHSLDRAFEGAGQPYEAHLRSEESGRASGYVALGTPVMRTGHTDSHAWAHTENQSDTRDAWLLRFDHPADPLAYRWDGGWQTAEAFTDTIAVNTTQGVVRRPYTFLRTPLGPVVARHGEGAAIAVRIARMEEGGALQQWQAMARAQSLEEFRAALALTALVGVNTIYADTAGNILYTHGSAVPRRAAGSDPDRLLDGSDAGRAWDGYHPLEDLPQLLNPGNGWLQSAGGSPFRAAAEGYNLEAARYPAYIAAGADNARARRARELLRGEEAWTREELETVAFDVRATAAGPLLRGLVDEYEQRGALDPAGVLALDEAVERLRAWDSRASIESTEMTLFVTWYERLQSPFASAGGGWPLTRALGWTLERLQQEWGTTEVPWGTLNRHVRARAAVADSAGLPLPGGPAWTGSLFGAAPAADRPGAVRRLASGIAWSGVVELSVPPRMRSVVAYGQSGDPASPHFFDQARLMAEGRMKAAGDTAGAGPR